MDEKIRPTVLINLTNMCNYSCPYCIGKNNRGDKFVDYAVFEKFLDFLDKSAPNEQWTFRLGGGEPTIHPDFLKILREVTSRGHKIGFMTNLSADNEKLKAIIDATGENLEQMGASLHLDMIPSLEEFMEKALFFIKHKNPKSGFGASIVLTEPRFDEIVEIKKKFDAAKIPLNIQPMIENKIYVKYSDKVEEFMKKHKENITSKHEKIRNQNTYGLKCYAGMKYFSIDVNGTVYRCHDKQPGWLLGNILKDTFKPFSEPGPCLAQQCTCYSPVIRNIIKFDERMLSLPQESRQEL